jgi:mono/diheme cytochrome c family protein
MHQPSRPIPSDRAPLRLHRRGGAASRSLILAIALATLARAPARAEAPSGDPPAQGSDQTAPPATEASPTTDAPAATSAASAPLDFFADIQPIISSHCLKCHGPERRSGGLRLDSRDFAEEGGDSGKQILGGTTETNELFARVSSKDRTYRMPKNAPALSDDEIERIRQWVAEGSAWAPTSRGVRRDDKPFYEGALLWAGGITDRYKSEFVYAKPYALIFLAVQLILLAVARAKVAHTAGRAWAQGRARRFCAFASRLTSREMTLTWLLSVALLAIVLFRAHELKIAADLAVAQKSLGRTESPWSRTIYGYPPMPIRFDHPKQMAGTYYRGNCERNSELYNNGNYLTAIFRIGLCDAQHQAVDTGSPLPPDGLLVRVEIERAPGTTDALFSAELMSSVFLTEQFLADAVSSTDKPIARLETLEANHRWVAYVPIRVEEVSSQASGLIYVYTGRVENGEARGQPHYGLKYDLRFSDGRLAADSDLWMNSFGNPAVSEPQPPGRIPYREWFDDRPMPVIEGQNSQDPKLLGVEEYVRKGLIKAPSDPAADKPEKKADHKEE